MPRLQRPLDPNAVVAANAKLATETGGRQLTMEPKDAALRKKWVDAYLAAGGKEAKKFNPKPVKKAVQICPKTNWIEVEYLYSDGRVLNDKSKGIKGAVCIVSTLDGAEIARATTDQNGFARINGLPNDITNVNYRFDKDPPKFEVFQEFKPETGITWQDVKDVAKWIGGSLAGDFNEDQSIGQIVVGTVITLIPIVDQAGDIRDIVAALKKLIFDKRYDEAGVWVDLVITIIGCIPELGTVIKGVLKSIKKSEKGIKLAELLRKLNWVGKGNAVQWLKKLSGDLINYGKIVAAKIKRILDGISTKLEKVKKIATEKIAAKLDEILESIKEVRKRVDDKVNEVIGDLKKRLDEILSESSEKLEKKGNTQQKNTLKQEKEEMKALASKKLEDLKKQGHGPQRHEGQMTEKQLEERARLKLDPETGTRTDKYTGKNHKCGDHATKVNSEESYVKAEEKARNSDKFKDAVKKGETDIKVEPSLEDIYGPNYKNEVSGRSRTAPWPDTTTPTKATDFTDGKMVAIYSKDASGNYVLKTMYPQPK